MPTRSAAPPPTVAIQKRLGVPATVPPAATGVPITPSPRGAERIEPWPPPIPTRYAIFPGGLRSDLKTVGAFASALHAELNRAGIYELRYWGAPNGFALVTRIEPIDDHGRPVEAARPTDAARTGLWGGAFESLYESSRWLISSPLRDSRMLLFVVTDDTEIRHPDAAMTRQTGEKWNRDGRFMLPQIDREKPLTSNHLVAVFVYEFRKDHDGVPRAVKDSHRSVEGHLRASGVNMTGLLK